MSKNILTTPSCLFVDKSDFLALEMDVRRCSTLANVMILVMASICVSRLIEMLSPYDDEIMKDHPDILK